MMVHAAPESRRNIIFINNKIAGTNRNEVHNAHAQHVEEDERDAPAVPPFDKQQHVYTFNAEQDEEEE